VKNNVQNGVEMIEKLTIAVGYSRKAFKKTLIFILSEANQKNL
jgi:hypothetical protein